MFHKFYLPPGVAHPRVYERKYQCASCCSLLHGFFFLIRFVWSGISGRTHAAEAQVVAAARALAFATAADQIAAAVLAGTQERSAAQHAFLLSGFAGVEGGIGSLGIAGRAALR